VNAPYEESNLLKLSESELSKKFGSMEVSIIDYQEGTLRDLHAEKKRALALSSRLPPGSLSGRDVSGERRAMV